MHPMNPGEGTVHRKLQRASAPLSVKVLWQYSYPDHQQAILLLHVDVTQGIERWSNSDHTQATLSNYTGIRNHDAAAKASNTCSSP